MHLVVRHLAAKQLTPQQRRHTSACHRHPQIPPQHRFRVLAIKRQLRPRTHLHFRCGRSHLKRPNLSWRNGLTYSPNPRHHRHARRAIPQPNRTHTLNPPYRLSHQGQSCSLHRAPPSHTPVRTDSRLRPARLLPFRCRALRKPLRAARAVRSHSHGADPKHSAPLTYLQFNA